MPCGVFRCISVDFGVFRCISVFTLTLYYAYLRYMPVVGNEFCSNLI